MVKKLLELFCGLVGGGYCLTHIAILHIFPHFLSVEGIVCKVVVNLAELLPVEFNFSLISDTSPLNF